MARLDIHARRDGRAGLLLDVRVELLSGFNTRLVVPPLSQRDVPAPAAQLNRVFEIAGERLVRVNQFATAVHTSELGVASRPSMVGTRKSPRHWICSLPASEGGWLRDTGSHAVNGRGW